MSSQPLRIAMWSGPRNISTAMLRSWGNRPDTHVTDEPLYAHYLKATGLPHPGADEVIAAGETDWQKVAETLTGPIPGGKPIWYQKHMSHHMLPQIKLGWLRELTHAFLIREPREMLTSLIAVTPNPGLRDTGLPQQVELFGMVQEWTGATPPVVDSKEVLDNPRSVLSQLCDRLGIRFTDAMLQWPAGRRETDGIWAKHWYAAVEKSTGFQAYKPKPEPVPDRFLPLLAQCEELYSQLYMHRIVPQP